MLITSKMLKESLQGNSNSGQVSKKAVDEAEKFLQNVVHELGKQASEQFNQLNERRKKLGLPVLKRLDAWTVKKAEEKVFSNTNNTSMGSQPKPPETGNPGGNKMSADNATKLVNTTDDNREVV